MPRRVFLSFALALALLMVDCSPQSKSIEFTQEPEVQMDLEQIRERGFLQAIVDNNSISYFIYRGQPMGFEYELLQSLTRHLNIKLKIKVLSGVEKSIDLLNKGEGDIIAFPLTITPERTNYVSFTNPQFNTYEVLVQKKPANWRRMPPSYLEKNLVRSVSGLVGKEVYVMNESSFKGHLDSLSKGVGGAILIKEDSASAETESLIQKVAKGEMQYTVTDQTIGMVNAIYYPNLDINTVLSAPQRIAWAARKNSPHLMDAINQWMTDMKRKGKFQILYNKYFNSPRSSQRRITSDYSSVAGNKLSPYDEVIKREALALGWDWRLLASVVYQESNFQADAASWAGAVGLMQLMPSTAEQFGVVDRTNPYQSLKAGARYLKYLDKLWAKYIPDKNERLKFVLSSYNAGLAHIIDARALARKYGKDPGIWANVEFYLKQKSNPKYYRDPLVVSGYCKCEEPVNFVRDILTRYEEYKLVIAAV
ncbi:transporter substrate-binding domain-containing protein [soil metagenome]